MRTLFIALTFAIISPAFASTVKGNHLSKHSAAYDQPAKLDIGENDPPPKDPKPKG